MKKFYRKKYRLIVPVIALTFGLSFVPNQMVVLELPPTTKSGVVVG